MAIEHRFDAIILGGGFYGTVIATYLAQTRKLKKVLLVEQEGSLMRRASYNNQARVHNGYHYPRSFMTAYRSRVNFPRFVHDWPQAVRKDFTSLYAIARRNSKVTVHQFERFCHNIGAKLQPAPAKLTKLFEPRLIEQVFQVEEYSFDSTQLAEWADRELAASGVEVRLLTKASSIIRQSHGPLTIALSSRGTESIAEANFVFNCTYSGLNHLGGNFPGTSLKLKQEITEIALMEAPPELKDLGVTLMDGPFFSFTPFPARGVHSLSHVRYTPHTNWLDEPNVDPYARLSSYQFATRAGRMARDSARYLPPIGKSKYVDSLLEVKTILVKNEGDDGRPILFERHHSLPGCFSILGGKLDNIYDVLEKLDAEIFNIS